MNSKKNITKSCQLGTSPDIVEFVRKQKNFSRSIRVLIQQSMLTHGGRAVDVYEEHEYKVNQYIYQNELVAMQTAEQIPAMPQVQPASQVPQTSQSVPAMPNIPIPEPVKKPQIDFSSVPETGRVANITNFIAPSRSSVIDDPMDEYF